MNQAPVVTIARYRKPDGYETRFRAVSVDGKLLAVTAYRKWAEAVRQMILGMPINGSRAVFWCSAE